MNCQKFDDIARDLAQAQIQAQIMDATMRESGLAHAATCEYCATRLADERTLAAGLKAMAASAEDSAAPPRIEAALLAAFRQQTATAKSNIVVLPVKQRRTQFWPLAAAAALLISASGFVASRWLSHSSMRPQTVTLSPSPTASTTVNAVALPSPPKDDQAFLIIRDGGGRPSIKKRGKRSPRAASADGSYVIASFGEFTPVFGNQESGPEVVTDFLPLLQASDSQPLESGQLIRVQMPRSALASFGLPVNQEYANVPVKADVLLAEDGSARAIRFVR